MRNPQIEYSLNKHVPSEPHWIVVESAFSQFVIMTYLQVMCIYIYMQLFDYLLRILLLIWQYIHIYNTFAYIILIFFHIKSQNTFWWCSASDGVEPQRTVGGWMCLVSF